MQSVCVFCRSNAGAGDDYAEAARGLARAIAARGLNLVYGGGSIGLMGTLDELFEMLTWTQLGIHRKPCTLLDVNGYFEQLGMFLDHAVSQRFIKAEHRSMLITGTDPEALLDQMLITPLPEVSKWMAPGKY